MKTALEQAIASIEAGQAENFVSDVEYVKEHLQSLLELEKQQIEKAFEDGMRWKENGYNRSALHNYFTQTFKND